MQRNVGYSFPEYGAPASLLFKQGLESMLAVRHYCAGQGFSTLNKDKTYQYFNGHLKFASGTTITKDDFTQADPVDELLVEMIQRGIRHTASRYSSDSIDSYMNAIRTSMAKDNYTALFTLEGPSELPQFTGFIRKRSTGYPKEGYRFNIALLLDKKPISQDDEKGQDSLLEAMSRVCMQRIYT